MARFDSFPYTRILKMVTDPKCNGIGYLQRVWVPFANPKEPFVWRSRSWFVRMLVWGLLAGWLVLMFDAAFGNGPRGVVPLLPLLGLFLVAPFYSAVGRVCAPVLSRRRAVIATEAFASSVDPSGQLDLHVVEAARLAFGRIYGVPALTIAPGDSERSLRIFLGTHIPYAFEVVLGARLIMGDQYCTDDPGVDDILQEVHDTADTVADIVRIMSVAYGSRAAKGGAARSNMSGEGAG